MPIFTEEAEPAFTRIIEASESICRVPLKDLAALNAHDPLRYAARRIEHLCVSLKAYQEAGVLPANGSKSDD